MPKLTSVRLSDELAARLARLAELEDRSKSWIIEQAVARYVDEELPEVVAVAEALEEYRKGGERLKSHEEVMSGLDSRIRAAENARSLA